MNHAFIAPQEFISMEQAIQMCGWSMPWLIRKLNEHGITRIGKFIDYNEFKGMFSQRAKQRQRRIIGHTRSPMMLPKSNRAGSAREFVKGLV